MYIASGHLAIGARGMNRHTAHVLYISNKTRAQLRVDGSPEARHSVSV
jgi:hypothetical protein